MTAAQGARRRGLVLLEVLVALIVLSLVGVAALQLVHQSQSTAVNAQTWSDAVGYAEDGMELAKLESVSLHGPPGDALPGGFRRQITRHQWGTAARPLELVTVTVFLPGGGRFDLDRVARIADDGTEQW
jgi:type II secretory pathway pseudopilin PulG